MSHHYSGADLGFPGGDARLDFTDLYAFPKPGDPTKSILIMNVHPSVGLQPSGPTIAEAFAPEALYEIKIDTDGDAVANIAYQVSFASSAQGQTATLRLLDGVQAAGTGEGGQIIVEGAPVSTARHAHGELTAVIIASSQDGAAIPSFSTRGAPSITFSSLARISSPSETFAASCWKRPTPRSGRKKSAYGLAR